MTNPFIIGEKVTANEISKQSMAESSSKNMDVNHKDLEQTSQTNRLENPNARFNESDISDGCSKAVKQFYKNDIDCKYYEGGIKERVEIVYNFYNKIKEVMGIDASLKFKEMPDYRAGKFSPKNNEIIINSKYLENGDFWDKRGTEGLIKTILHEARHAFQTKCVNNPDSVNIDKKKILEWGKNMANYIKPEFNFLQYRFQPIESDAYDFSDSIYQKGNQLS